MFAHMQSCHSQPRSLIHRQLRVLHRTLCLQYVTEQCILSMSCLFPFRGWPMLSCIRPDCKLCCFCRCQDGDPLQLAKDSGEHAHCHHGHTTVILGITYLSLSYCFIVSECPLTPHKVGPASCSNLTHVNTAASCHNAIILLVLIPNIYISCHLRRKIEAPAVHH